MSPTGSVGTDPSDAVVVFLDIDGVLLPFGQLLFPEPQLEALSRILEAFDGARVVLSSTWRVQPKFIQDILDQFRVYGDAYGGPLADLDFFDITDPQLHSERHLEIDAWLLQQTSPPAAWVALDDEDLLGGGTVHTFEGRAVRTDSHEGLTEEMAQLAIQFLERQLAEKGSRKR